MYVGDICVRCAELFGWRCREDAVRVAMLFRCLGVLGSIFQISRNLMVQPVAHKVTNELLKSYKTTQTANERGNLRKLHQITVLLQGCSVCFYTTIR